MNEPDVYFQNCGWDGMTDELDGAKCPKCGESKDIEDYYIDDPPIWEYHKPYNWNKP